MRKSIVSNSGSMAGGPQIFAPTAKYARNNFGILSLAFREGRGASQRRLREGT